MWLNKAIIHVFEASVAFMEPPLQAIDAIKVAIGSLLTILNQTRSVDTVCLGERDAYHY